jgi:hypothetical protein
VKYRATKEDEGCCLGYCWSMFVKVLKLVIVTSVVSVTQCTLTITLFQHLRMRGNAMRCNEFHLISCNARQCEEKTTKKRNPGVKFLSEILCRGVKKIFDIFMQTSLYTYSFSFIWYVSRPTSRGWLLLPRRNKLKSQNDSALSDLTDPHSRARRATFRLQE